MSAVVEAVSNVVSSVVDFAGDVVQTVVDTAADVVKTVADTASKVVESAVNDPIGTIAKIGTAIFAPELLPFVNAADVVAHGGDIEDALTAAAVSYVAPEVGNYVGAEIAGTSFGDALTSAADATGIESLPGAVARGIGTAATSTVANVARGQDFGDALQSGAISGVASIAGRIAGAEADTGYALGDRLIGTAVGAATNASLRGGDVDTAIENSVARDLLGTGFGLAGGEIKSAVKDWQSGKPEQGIASLEESVVTPRESIATETGVEAPFEKTMLASLDTGTKTDAGGAPPGFYVDFDGSIKPIQRIDIEGTAPTSEDSIAKQSSDEMFDALVKAFSEKGEETKVDALGNVYDSQGNFIGYASDFGMTMTSDPNTGGIAWQTEQGEVIKPTSFGPEITTPTPSAETTAAIVGEQAGDYPIQIINNPDGSVTSVESNGTSYTFNVDGSITFTDYEGNQSIVGGSQEAVEQPKPEETTQTTTDSTLTNLVNSLVGPIGSTLSAPSTSTISGIAPFVAGAALGATLDNQGSYSPYGFNPYGFNWNPADINAPENAIAYGQQYFEPTYTAAEGGLMSLHNQPVEYIQQTVPNLINTNKMMIQQDPTSSVQMYSRGGISHLGSYSDGGRMLKGPGDGMSDDIPATIAGRQPARLANEEFVIPADVVSHLGNGSSEAGAKVLYKMMADVRKARTGKTKQASQIKPERFMPRR